MKHILLIEDNRYIRENLAMILEDQPYRVTTAENGTAGIEKAWTLKPDVIITDIMMPGLTGLEVLALLKQDPEMCHIPVILLSARGSQVDMQEGFQAGAANYLVKPFHEQELLLAVSSCLKNLELASV